MRTGLVEWEQIEVLRKSRAKFLDKPSEAGGIQVRESIKEKV
jgi:hypothetical protein